MPLSALNLKAATADADAMALGELASALEGIGVKVLLQANSANELLKHQEIDDADLLVADVSAIEGGGQQGLAAVLQRHEVPLIVTSAEATDEALERAHACRPLAHLVKPVRKDGLRAAIMLSIQRFEELKTLRSEASNLSQALEERKLIERAKGIIMRQKQVEESEAFIRLQRIARDHRIKLIDAANSVIKSEVAFS